MVARYEEVARSIVRDIQEGVYPLKGRLPTEVELAEQFAVSRSTIRSALQSLEKLGMISRRRKLGTQVLAVRPTAGYARTVSNINELVQYSVETTRVVLATEEAVADATLAERLGWHTERPLAHLRMLRIGELGTSRPLCHTDVYLDADVAAIIGDRINNPDGLISEMIERCTGRMTERVDQRIRAMPLPVELSDVLHAEAGAACLEIRRRYFDTSDQIVLVTISLHPGDRFEFDVPMHRHA